MTVILASKSASRQAMLSAAGVAFEAIPAHIDERAVEAGLAGRPPEEVVRMLAIEKALAISTRNEDRLVLGSDSLIVVDGRRFDKPTSRDDAAEHLRFFSGREMHLHSAAALVRRGAVQTAFVDRAVLHVRPLSEDFIARYLEAEWPEVGHCVGVFRMEGLGVQMFDFVEGDYFSILGMPLLKVLAGLRQFGELPA